MSKTIPAELLPFFSTIGRIDDGRDSYLARATVHDATIKDSFSVAYFDAADEFEITFNKGLRRTSGFEDVAPRRVPLPVELPEDVRLQQYRERVARRVRAVTRAVVLSNTWDFWYTQTFDARKVPDRHNRDECFRLWYEVHRAINRGREEKSQYVMFPERHDDGAIHFHGFLRGVPKDVMRFNEYGFLEISAFADRLGFMNIKSVKRGGTECSKMLGYALKYAQKSISEMGEHEHAYYCSHGLHRGVRRTVRAGTTEYEIFSQILACSDSWENEYIKRCNIGSKKLTELYTAFAAEK